MKLEMNANLAKIHWMCCEQVLHVNFISCNMSVLCTQVLFLALSGPKHKQRTQTSNGLEIK